MKERDTTMITALSEFFPALLLRWIYGYDCLVEHYVFGENITRTGTCCAEIEMDDKRMDTDHVPTEI